MNKAVIYISGTMNETVDNMVVRVIERYCEKHGYEIAAQSGMSMPMKYSFIGMAEVEDIDTVVTLSSAMVGTTDDEIMETIDLLAHYGITVETAKEDMSAYYDALGSDGYCGCDDSSMDDTQITSLSVWYQADSRIKEAVMEQTGTNQCLVFVGSMETHVADRMEDYARQNDMNVVDTVFKDDKAIDKLTYYIEREGIICILVRSIWDISTDRETVKSIMKLASDHNISINEENKGFEPATLVWDGGAGC